MKRFKVGCFYGHEAGRQIAILKEVETSRWGAMYVVEEVDKTGHAISCMEVNEVADIEKQGWVEIGKPEFMRNFEESTCDACGKIFQDGDKFVPTDDGPIHVTCYSEIIKERGPEFIEPVSVH
jgi:hypothetical protein